MQLTTEKRVAMGYNQQDIVILFSTIVSKIINFILMIVFILVAGLVIYGFYIFIFQPYEPGQDPVQKWMKEHGYSNKPKTFNLIEKKFSLSQSMLDKTGLLKYLV